VYISLFTFAPGVARRVSALGITQADNWGSGRELFLSFDKNLALLFLLKNK
jgi:hypothetical protein